MKKIIIVGLSLFMGTQAFAFGMNMTGGATTENYQGDVSVRAEAKAGCVATKEYEPVCAIRMGDAQPKTYGNKGKAKCAEAVIVHFGACDENGEKKTEQKKHEVEAKVKFDAPTAAFQAVADKMGVDMNGKNIADMGEKLKEKMEAMQEIQSPEEAEKMFQDFMKKNGITADVEKARNLIHEKGEKFMNQFKERLQEAQDGTIDFSQEEKEALKNELKQKLQKEFSFDSLADVEVEKENGKVMYQVKAQKKAKFLGLFNTNVEVEATVDAETGEVVEVDEHWYSFLLF